MPDGASAAAVGPREASHLRDASGRIPLHYVVLFFFGAGGRRRRPTRLIKMAGLLMLKGNTEFPDSAPMLI